ncbi:MAG: hypothetical protein WC816_12705, partial [Sphingomonas sp.]
LPLELFCMLDHLAGLLERALCSQATGAKTLQVQFALSQFDALCRNWWKFLVAHGLIDRQSGSPDWMNNKLNRIFPPHL